MCFVDVLDEAEEVPFYPYFAENFHQEWTLDFVKFFYYIY